MKTKDISILIPTIDRPELLLKQLDFYLQYKVEFSINICDSTHKPKKAFLEKIKYFSEILSINYFHKPKLNDRQATFFLIENCKTKYSAFIADDDYFIPEGIIKCAHYLEGNNDYRVAYGRTIQIDMATINKSKSKLKASHYSALDISFDEESPKERVDKLSENYVVSLFGVHRTNEFINDFKVSGDISSQSMGEILVNYLTILRGKAKSLSYPYLIRQDHSKRYLPPKRFLDLLVDDNFGKSIPVFVDNISSSFMQKGVIRDQSILLAKSYIKSILNKSIKQTHIKDLHKFESLYKKLFITKFKKISFSFKNYIFMKSSYFRDFENYLEFIRTLN